MHVVFVCASHKRAIGRTAVVLDAYAMRCGERAWATRITDEGLAEVRQQLRRTASRSTAVACFRNDGRTRMRLVWTVGRAHAFGYDGRYPVASTHRPRRLDYPAFVRAAALIADAAGHTHDLGKYGQPFQDKLRRAGPVADAIRHEWLSAQLLEVLADPSRDWPGAWQQVAHAEAHRPPGDHRATPFEHALGSAFDVLRFAVVTHHRLPRDGLQNVMDATAYVRDEDRSAFETFVVGPAPALLAQIRRRLARVQDQQPPAGVEVPLYWRAVALVARMALILADHSVSGRDLANSANCARAQAFANTTRTPSGRRLNQLLDWHLEQVGHDSGDLVARLWSYRPPALSPGAVDRIQAPSGAGRFAWQDRAAAALRASASAVERPTLVLNIAATGAGKTRANVRLLAALRPAGGLRVAVALNLRSLTLQTGDTYARELGIGADELACVIGDRAAAQLHRFTGDSQSDDQTAARVPALDDDENPPEPQFVAVGDDELPPAWLAPFFARRASMASVVTMPLVVSTVDFLIAAGEPGRQAHHVLAMLRLMSSDLIVDEIDGYEPKALVAVLRLVLYAAFWGRHVVASSATLAEPVAVALRETFEFGARMRAAALGASADWQVALVSDTQATSLMVNPAAGDFAATYTAYVERMLAPLVGARLRPAELWPVARPSAVPTPIPAKPGRQTLAQKEHTRTQASLARMSGQGWFAAVADATQCMHERHRWSVTLASGQTAWLSLGLVRVANIRTAIRLARFLSDRLGDQASIACYHSQLVLMHRWYLERALDVLLTRKDAGAADRIAAHPAVQGRLLRAPAHEQRFIVVATPVEEVGRDHDFDWAVIEPSSTHSIVQCAGRVNRHRLQRIDAPNIAVLQHNLRAWQGPPGAIAFTRPGFESEQARYPTHDLGTLLDWSRIEQIDARLRFGGHALRHHDDRAIEAAIRHYLGRLLGRDPNANLWMSETTYRNTPLRDRSDQQHAWWVRTTESGQIEYLRRELTATGPQWVLHSAGVVRTPTRAANDWLVPEPETIESLARRSGLAPDDAFSVTVRVTGDASASTGPLLEHDQSFGFYGRSI